MEMQNYNIVQAKNNLFPKVARTEHLDAQNFAGSLDLNKQVQSGG